MATEFGVSFDRMDDASKKLEDGQIDIEQLLEDLQGVVDDLVEDGVKTEKAAENYRTKYQELTDSLKEAAQSVGAMAQWLDKTADDLRGFDDDHA